MRNKNMSVNDVLSEIECWIQSLNFKKIKFEFSIKNSGHPELGFNINEYSISENAIYIRTNTGIWSYGLDHNYTSSEYALNGYIESRRLETKDWYVTWPSNNSKARSNRQRMSISEFKKLFLKIIPVSAVIETYYNVLEALGYKMLRKKINIVKYNGCYDVIADYSALPPQEVKITPMLHYCQRNVNKWKISLQISPVHISDNEILYYLSNVLKMPPKITELLYKNPRATIHEQCKMIQHELRGNIASREFNI